MDLTSAPVAFAAVAPSKTVLCERESRNTVPPAASTGSTLKWM